MEGVHTQVRTVQNEFGIHIPNAADLEDNRIRIALGTL